MWETAALLFVIGLLAIISPGPDLFLILRNTSRYERQAALATVWGITGGILVHIAYSIAGIAILISQSIVFYNALRLAGAGYLIYIGWKSLRSRPPVEAAVQLLECGHLA